MSGEELEKWAEELQNSKLDLIELLQRHLEMVEELQSQGGEGK